MIFPVMCNAALRSVDRTVVSKAIQNVSKLVRIKAANSPNLSLVSHSCGARYQSMITLTFKPHVARNERTFSSPRELYSADEIRTSPLNIGFFFSICNLLAW